MCLQFWNISFSKKNGQYTPSSPTVNRGELIWGGELIRTLIKMLKSDVISAFYYQFSILYRSQGKWSIYDASCQERHTFGALFSLYIVCFKGRFFSSFWNFRKVPPLQQKWQIFWGQNELKMIAHLIYYWNCHPRGSTYYQIFILKVDVEGGELIWTLWDPIQ